MDNYYFSPSTLAFYPECIISLYEAAGTLPKDLIEVSYDIFITYSGIPPEGKTRGAFGEGIPAWVTLPPLNYEQKIEVVEADKLARIEQANNYMNNKQWPGKAVMGRLSSTEVIHYNLWLDYLEALESIDTAIVPEPQWPTRPE